MELQLETQEKYLKPQMEELTGQLSHPEPQISCLKFTFQIIVQDILLVIVELF